MKFITTPEKKNSGDEIVTQCTLCSEDPNYCGDDGEPGGSGNGTCPWYGCRSKFLHL